MVKDIMHAASEDEAMEILQRTLLRRRLGCFRDW